MHRRRPLFLAAAVLTALLIPCGAFAGNKGTPTLIKLPPQTAELKGLQLVRAKQPCPNWAWAAIVEMMLAKQDAADLKQSDWILKGYSGEVCIETPVDLESVKHVVDGDYVLMTGRKVRFETVIASGAPTDVGHLIQSVNEGTVVMLLWRGRPMVLRSLEYDEYIYPNDQRMFEARTLTLIDPITGQSEVFEKTKDDMGELGGLLEVRVFPRSN
jgi:hypothetical protein